RGGTAMEKRSTKRLKGKAPDIGKRDRVFVGLDVHKRSIHAAVRINGQELGSAVLPAEAKAVLKFPEPYRPGLKSVVYEAGPTGYGLLRALRKAELPASVVAPGKIPRPAVSAAKSDQLDCKMLAEFAEKDLLHEVGIPTLQEEEDRQIQRQRDSTLKRRRQTKQRIRGLLLQHNLPEPEGLEGWGRKSLLVLQKMPLSLGLRFSLDLLLEDLYHLQDQMDRINQRLKKLAKEQRYARAAERLKTHPGVGDVTCMQVLTELYQPERFENSKQVAAYVGLAPQVRQSGETHKEGPLLRGGRGALRATLVEAAWSWLRHDKLAAKLYGRLVKNTGSGKKAIVAMARKLVVHLWTMLVCKQDYRPLAA
ncbi:MAG: IS110 family transposase, partial [bacterium]